MWELELFFVELLFEVVLELPPAVLLCLVVVDELLEEFLLALWLLFPLPEPEFILFVEELLVCVVVVPEELVPAGVLF